MSDRHGVVVAFDEHQGLGTIRGGDDVEVPFHCTAIVDGTRTIDVGASVAYGLAPKLGRWEAVAVTPA